MLIKTSPHHSLDTPPIPMTVHQAEPTEENSAAGDSAHNITGGQSGTGDQNQTITCDRFHGDGSQEYSLVHYSWGQFVSVPARAGLTRHPSWSPLLDPPLDKISRLSKLKTRISQRILGRVGPTFASLWDITGDEVDVGAYVQGLPEHMVYVLDRTVRQRRFQLDVTVSVASGDNGLEPLIAAIILVGACDLVGVRAKLSLLDCAFIRLANGESKLRVLKVTVKDTTERFNPRRIAGLLSGTDVLGAMLTIVDCEPEIPFRHVYGAAHQVPEAIQGKPHFEAVHTSPTQYFDGLGLTPKSHAALTHTLMEWRHNAL